MGNQLIPDPFKNVVDRLKEKSGKEKLTQSEEELIRIYTEQKEIYEKKIF